MVSNSIKDCWVHSSDRLETKAINAGRSLQVKEDLHLKQNIRCCILARFICLAVRLNDMQHWERYSYMNHDFSRTAFHFL